MPIELVEYDACWPGAYECARRELLEAFGCQAFIGFEHIGSTAVPGLAAKPIVDMLAAVRDLVWAESARPVLEALRYAPWFGEPGRVSFERRNEAARATHHLHVVVWGSPNWLEPLQFRDLLRQCTDRRVAYEQMKRSLALAHDETRSYTAAKSGFIGAMLRTAENNADS